MFFIFEMANNHQGDLEHAKSIIKTYASLAEKYQINAAIKFQFRQLDTFIHPAFKDSDLKYVKRFNETKLKISDFIKLSRLAKNLGLKTVATPFDNESLPLLDLCDIDIIKIASCSVDDWQLLRDISNINKKVIISTAGASIETLQDVYSLFKSKGRDFAFLHCVAEYPTPPTHANLKRIKRLQETFSDTEIGFSTHESPDEESLVPFALALGCTIFEKHIAVSNSRYDINKYSCTPDEIEKIFKKIKRFNVAFEGESSCQDASLQALKRGLYAKNTIQMGSIIENSDIFFAMPCQEGQINASSIDQVVGAIASTDIPGGHAIEELHISHKEDRLLEDIKDEIRKQLIDAKISISSKDTCEISCHYGLINFREAGAFIIDKINREYCKKLIVLLPGQHHPVHYHVRKEECFELLSGDCKLVLNKKQVEMEKGKVNLIPRKTKHSFYTHGGCVLEEISTTHIQGDSIYEDPIIFKLPISKRKIKVRGFSF